MAAFYPFNLLSYIHKFSNQSSIKPRLKIFLFVFFLYEIEDASEKEKRDLLSEMSVLKNLDPHPHVIRLYGCVSTEGTFNKAVMIHRRLVDRMWKLRGKRRLHQ